MELWQEIIEKQKMLDKAIKELAQNGYKLAECERDYKIAVNKKALELRSQDVPVTLINQVIYGYEDIAKQACKVGCGNRNLGGVQELKHKLCTAPKRRKNK